jgi:hypothetical protein
MIFELKNRQLIEASRIGDIEKVKKLLKEGADVNAKNGYDATPLHLASLHGHVEIVKLLIENGADVNAKSSYDVTPLHFAAYYGHIQVVKVLLEHGADPNIMNKDGKAAIDLAFEKGYSDIVNLILEFAYQILSLKSSKLVIGKWGQIIVKVKGIRAVSINLEGDLEWINPGPKELSRETTIKIPVKPKTYGKIPVKIIIDTPYGKRSSTIFLKVKPKILRQIIIMGSMGSCIGIITGTIARAIISPDIGEVIVYTSTAILYGLILLLFREKD